MKFLGQLQREFRIICACLLSTMHFQWPWVGGYGLASSGIRAACGTVNGESLSSILKLQGLDDQFVHLYSRWLRRLPLLLCGIYGWSAVWLIGAHAVFWFSFGSFCLSVLSTTCYGDVFKQIGHLGHFKKQLRLSRVLKRQQKLFGDAVLRTS